MSQLIMASEKKLAKDLLISEKHVRTMFKEYKYAPGKYEEFMDYCVAMDYIDLPGYEEPLKRRECSRVWTSSRVTGSIERI